jgi:serine/threonine protein kinase
MNACLTQELAELYLAGGCSVDERGAIETHIAGCDTCSQQIEYLRSNTDPSSQQDVTRTYDKTIASDFAADMKTYVNEDKTITDSTPSSATGPDVKTTIDFDIFSGSTFEGYEIVGHLPPGGQAVVYKAIQKATKRVVALKVLLQGPQASKLSQYRFEREVDLAASLQHPNIVTIYDSGIAKGQYYFAMQYVPGKPLDEYIKSKNLSIRQIMELFNRVCCAVAYAHQRGVMHRDLKPGNILVDDDGQPQILDFGLAKLTGSSEETSHEMVMTSIPGRVIGTLAFMSPEQASAQPDAVDVRTDVYSIGVILYKILTDKFPYEITGSLLAILRSIQESEPTRPSKLLPRFNSEIEAIVLKTLEKNPDRRYQSAAHLQQDIDSWLKGLPIAARSDSSLYLLRKIMTRHYYASSVVALLLVIVLGFCSVCFQLYNKNRKSNVALEQTNKSLSDEIARYSGLTLKSSFTHFLRSWHANRLQDSSYIARFFVRGTREAAAASFLLSPKPLSEKAAGFRESLGETQSSFAEFIIAEQSLKNGDKAEAAGAYQKALSYREQIEKDQWLAAQIKSRLYDLTNEDPQSEAAGTAENQGVQ